MEQPGVLLEMDGEESIPDFPPGLWENVDANILCHFLHFVPRQTLLAMRQVSQRYHRMIDTMPEVWEFHWPKRSLFYQKDTTWCNHYRDDGTVQLRRVTTEIPRINIFGKGPHVLKKDDFDSRHYPEMVLLKHAHDKEKRFKRIRKKTALKAVGRKRSVANYIQRIQRLQTELSTCQDLLACDQALLTLCDTELKQLKALRKIKEAPIRKARNKRRREQRKADQLAAAQGGSELKEKRQRIEK